MAQDMNGHRLKAGDRVLIPARVYDFDATPGSNLSVELDVPNSLGLVTLLMLDSAQVQLVEPAGKPPLHEQTPPGTGGPQHGG